MQLYKMESLCSFPQTQNFLLHFRHSRHCSLCSAPVATTHGRQPWLSMTYPNSVSWIKKRRWYLEAKRVEAPNSKQRGAVHHIKLHFARCCFPVAKLHPLTASRSLELHSIHILQFLLLKTYLYKTPSHSCRKYRVWKKCAVMVLQKLLDWRMLLDYK